MKDKDISNYATICRILYDDVKDDMPDNELRELFMLAQENPIEGFIQLHNIAMENNLLSSRDIDDIGTLLETTDQTDPVKLTKAEKDKFIISWYKKRRPVLYSANQLAKMSGFSRSYISILIANGTIKAIRGKGRTSPWKISELEANKFLEKVAKNRENKESKEEATKEEEDTIVLHS